MASEDTLHVYRDFLCLRGCALSVCKILELFSTLETHLCKNVCSFTQYDVYKVQTWNWFFFFFSDFGRVKKEKKETAVMRLLVLVSELFIMRLWVKAINLKPHQNKVKMVSFTTSSLRSYSHLCPPLLIPSSSSSHLPLSQIDYDTAISAETQLCFTESGAPVPCLQCVLIDWIAPARPLLAFGLRTASLLPNSRCQIKQA